MSFEYTTPVDAGRLVFSEHPELGRKRNTSLTRDEEEDALPRALLREYRMYRDGAFRQNAMPEPPSVWRQSMPPLELDMERERELFAKDTATNKPFEKWLEAKSQTYKTLKVEFKKQLRSFRGKRAYSSFEQWLDYRYAEACAEQRLLAFKRRRK